MFLGSPSGLPGRTYEWSETMKKDAYMTVEAIFVFPTVFFSILLLIFMGIVMYQQSALYSLAARSASRGSIIYTTTSENMDNGIVEYNDFKNRNPYRFIFESKKTDKAKVINSYVESNVGKNNAYTGIDMTGTYSSGNGKYKYVTREGSLFKKIYVKINYDYNNPIKAVANLFGVESLFRVDVLATAPVSEPVELVRNVDLTLDYINRFTNGMDKLKNITDKINSLVNDGLKLDE